jgi:glucose/arabinose dehydrogenase
MRLLRAIATALLTLLLLGAASAEAASLQPVGKFEEPIYVTSDPGNANRLFVVERAGRIQQVENGVVSTFADIRSAVGCSGACSGERGLLSLAPAPDFDSSGRTYVDYVNNTTGTIHVAELTAVGASASILTLRDVLTIPHPEDNNHNGGQLQFGPDGHLYISTGDGGGSNDVHHNAQNLESLLGKILRIDPLPSGGRPYSVPAGNPFPAAAAPYDTIWSYGLRNPFRFSFDRLSGDLVIGDVGQSAREEVDYAPAPLLGAGANYGWNCREGFIEGPADDPGCSTASSTAFTQPVFDYPHKDPGGGAAHGCAIIGGYVVRDPSLGDLYGRYLYGDLCVGQLRSLELANPLSDRSEGLHVEDLNSFGEDSCGRLYVVSGDGQVSRLVGAAPAVCQESTPAAASHSPHSPHSPSFVGIRAVAGKVRHGGRASITAWVSPCEGRRGELIKLREGRRKLGSRYLSRACSVNFRPRIRHRGSFQASIGEDGTYVAAKSRKLRIRIEHPHHHEN